MSDDAIVRAEQKGDAFYRSAYELFSSNFKPATTFLLTFDSIKKRTRMVAKCCSAFAVYHARIVRTSPSGTNKEGYTQLAIALYNDVKVEAPRDDFALQLKDKLAYRKLSSH